MLYTCYLRDGIVYVPTVGKRGGAHVTMEPVSVVPVADSEGLRRAFAEAIDKGNPPLPLLKGERPAPIMLKYTRTKSWPAFVRNTRTWILKRLTTDLKSSATSRARTEAGRRITITKSNFRPKPTLRP